MARLLSLFVALIMLVPQISQAGTLQSLIADGKAAYNWTCIGSPCYAVVNEQVRALSALSNYVDSMPQPLTVDMGTGGSAWMLAHVVCGSSMRIDADYLLRLISAENRALLRLKRVQEAGGQRNPRFCSRVIQ